MTANPDHKPTPENAEKPESISNSSSAQSQPEAVSASLSEDKVREKLKEVIDPELFVNIVDLGLIYVVDLKDNQDSGKTDVLVEMTMTSPMCPAGPQLVANSRAAVEALDGVGEVEIKVVMDPPWTQDMMTEDARDQLNIF